MGNCVSFFVGINETLEGFCSSKSVDDFINVDFYRLPHGNDPSGVRCFGCGKALFDGSSLVAHDGDSLPESGLYKLSDGYHVCHLKCFESHGHRCFTCNKSATRSSLEQIYSQELPEFNLDQSRSIRAILEKNLNPSQFDSLIGRDPYHQICRREGDAYCDEPLPNSLISPSFEGRFPKIAHFIWFGKPICTRKSFLSAIRSFATFYNNYNLTTFLWCNSTAIDDAVKQFCAHFGVVLLNAFRCLPEGEFPLESAILYNLYASIPFNGAEASDMFRIYLEYKFGGVYLDPDFANTILDMEPKQECSSDECRRPLLLDLMKWATDAGKKVVLKEGNNDFWIAEPKCECFIELFRKMQNNYLNKTMKDFLSLAKTYRINSETNQDAESFFTPHLWMIRTMTRTGPLCIEEFRNHPSLTPILHELPQIEDDPSNACADSWAPSKLPNLIPSRDAPGVVTTLLRELKEAPEVLCLYRFEKLSTECLFEIVSLILERFPEACAQITNVCTRNMQLFTRITDLMTSKGLSITNDRYGDYANPRFWGFTANLLSKDDFDALLLRQAAAPS